MDIVNGYACRDCGDVALARRGVDPATGEVAARLAEQGERAAAPAASAPTTAGTRGRVVNVEA